MHQSRTIYPLARWFPPKSPSLLCELFSLPAKFVVIYLFTCLEIKPNMCENIKVHYISSQGLQWCIGECVTTLAHTNDLVVCLLQALVCSHYLVGLIDVAKCSHVPSISTQSKVRLNNLANSFCVFRQLDTVSPLYTTFEPVRLFAFVRCKLAISVCS